MSDKILKSYWLSQEEVEAINEVREREGCRTEVAALRHIIQEYKKIEGEEEQSRRIAEQILRIFSKEYEDYWKRLYSSVRATDKTLAVVQDALNTILLNEEYENCVPVDIYASPVIKESREVLKRKIGKRKQRKDRIQRRKKNEGTIS